MALHPWEPRAVCRKKVESAMEDGAGPRPLEKEGRSERNFRYAPSGSVYSFLFLTFFKN